MESTAIRCYNAFEGLDSGSPYGGIGPAQPGQLQYSYCANTYAGLYEPPTFTDTAMLATPSAASPDGCINVDFCDLDAGIYGADRQQRFDEANSQQRRESFSSSASSSTSSPPPTQDAYAHVPRTPCLDNGDYSGALARTVYEKPAAAIGAGGGGGGGGGGGANTNRRQNRKERQLQMEREEQQLAQQNADLRKVLRRLERQYNFLESRVTSLISQAAQPVLAIPPQQQQDAA